MKNDTNGERQRPDAETAIEAPRPYWTRAHHDWKFWVALIGMIAAMIIYVTSEDLSVGVRGKHLPPVPESVAP